MLGFVIQVIIYIQRSNQLSYRGQLLSCNRKFMYIQVIGCAGCDKVDLNDVVSCTSLGGINIRMLGFVIQVIIYILRSDQE
jgi:hypothetical protein